MADQIFNVNCGFFDSVNKDRLYTADEMSRPYKRIISNGVFATPKGTPSTDLQVLSAANKMNIIVKAGNGLFGDKWFENSSDLIVTVPSNTNIVPRSDSVIAQVDKRQNGRIGSIVYREGVPATNPLPPNIGTVDNVIEYRIANIYVAAGATTINQDAIVDLRGSSECPWITSLIQQVDTSTLFAQWQAAYQGYYDDTKDKFDAYYAENDNRFDTYYTENDNRFDAKYTEIGATFDTYYDTTTEEMDDYITTEKTKFETFMDSLTEDLSVTTSFVTFDSNYTTVGDNATTIPINIPSYNKSLDVLYVFINGLRAIPAVDYTISSDGTTITLTKPLCKDQNVSFFVMQSIVVADPETAITKMQELDQKIAPLLADSGWIDFTLESGATSFDATTKPAVRKCGNNVYIRGAIKGLDTVLVPIATLPVNMRPAMNYQFSSAIAYSGNTIAANCVIQIGTNGQILLLAKSGTIPATAMIPISTQFILG